MDAQFPRSRFGLDLLIAEAKRRMRRRRFLVGLVLVAVVFAAVLAARPWSGGTSPAAVAARPGIARIPAMTRVNSSGVGTSVCSGMKGTSLPHWCSTLTLRDGHYEAWILTSAFEQGDRYSVRASFARAHPGPAVVTDQWLRLASPRQARQLLREPDFTKSYTGSAAPAVNGGVARHLPPLPFPGQSEFEFFWASGPIVVNVNVIGADLTAGEAQRIALLARPR